MATAKDYIELLKLEMSKTNYTTSYDLRKLTALALTTIAIALVEGNEKKENEINI